LLATALACAALGAHAQRATITPSPAEIFDLVTLQFDAGEQSCPEVARDGLRMDGQTIRVSIQRHFDCGFGPYSSTSVTLGRFPAGDYAVEVYLLPPPGSLAPIRIVSTTGLHVNGYGDPFIRLKPIDNLTGHWMTELFGEAVTVTQFGTKAVASFLTYAVDGTATWYFIPDFVFRTDAAGIQFYGTIYATRGAAVGTTIPFARFVSATSAGTATLSGPDVVGGASLELQFTGRPRMTRSLRRLLF
jgi:hypothetical protein